MATEDSAALPPTSTPGLKELLKESLREILLESPSLLHPPSSGAAAGKYPRTKASRKCVWQQPAGVLGCQGRPQARGAADGVKRGE